jgi:hypothetical protein
MERGNGLLYRLRVGMNVERLVFLLSDSEAFQWFGRIAVIRLRYLFFQNICHFLCCYWVLFTSESERDPLKEGQETKGKRRSAQG